MLTKVKDFIKNYNMINTGDGVLAACSGGPDSLVLLHILRQLQSELNFSIKVAHVNHMLRGKESDEDERYVLEICRELGLTCYSAAVNVKEYASENGKTIEEAARILRYEYLNKTANACGCTKIATGHHLNDQAETVLLNVLRGAGSQGLRGMLPVNNNIIRPLLVLSRKDIDEYCRTNNITPRIDSTNTVTDYLRNRIRLELIPKLEEYNPNVGEAMARVADIMRDEYDFIMQSVEKVWHEVVCINNDKVLINIKKLNDLHNALQREIVRSAIFRKKGHTKGISFYHVEKIINLSKYANVGSKVELPGELLAVRGYNEISIITQNEFFNDDSGKVILPPGIKLNIPGITLIPQLDLTITAKIGDSFEKRSCDCAFDFAKIRMPLYVRSRVPGDKFCPTGMQHCKKLKEYFIDEKIPRADRDRIPLLCDEEGIISVGKLRQSERTKVIKSSDKVLFLYFNK